MLGKVLTSYCKTVKTKRSVLTVRGSDLHLSKREFLYFLSVLSCCRLHQTAFLSMGSAPTAASHLISNLAASRKGLRRYTYTHTVTLTNTRIKLLLFQNLLTGRSLAAETCKDSVHRDLCRSSQDSMHSRPRPTSVHVSSHLQLLAFSLPSSVSCLQPLLPWLGVPLRSKTAPPRSSSI